MIKAIFWDNDGILVDTEKLYFKATKEIFKKIDINLTEELFIEYFLKKNQGTWFLARDKGIDEEQIELLRDERNEYYQKLLSNETEVIDGVEEVLKKLQGKVSMGIVTSSRRNHFETIHEKTGLLKYFNFSITSDECPETKPSNKPYIMALDRSGYQREECIIVEDSERGLISARRAGIKCYVIPTELTKDSDFTGAYKILNNISELPDEII